MFKTCILFYSVIIFSCTNNDINKESPEAEVPLEQNTPNPDVNNQAKKFKILALGDSYTIGQSVCETCRFPEQLKSGLKNNYSTSEISLEIIAQTGWTTSNLKTAINSKNLSNDYDLVTLLIGVNNQYLKIGFNIYQTEFPELLNKAISLAKANSNKVIVISIPDYAYTPFGQYASNSSIISSELDAYNDFAETYSKEKGVTYVHVTDITRNGLENPNLVASDGLHPSFLAYSKFVERILPIAIEKLK